MEASTMEHVITWFIHAHKDTAPQDIRYPAITAGARRRATPAPRRTLTLEEMT